MVRRESGGGMGRRGEDRGEGEGVGVGGKEWGKRNMKERVRICEK